MYIYGTLASQMAYILIHMLIFPPELNYKRATNLTVSTGSLFLASAAIPKGLFK